jgi:UDP-N-acetylglucosamine 2-epimerase (non-hydrolysing)
MPEEINRVLTDQISDMLFTPSDDADQNLAREGISREKIHLVGNVMIDTLLRMLPFVQNEINASPLRQYALVTLHRPSNVDDLPWLTRMINTLTEIGEQMAVLFPVHPRTRQRLVEAGLRSIPNEQVRLTDPLTYLDFLALQVRATVVITDSGGIQEETTFLGVPCLTVRENTERPITVSCGTNVLVGRDLDRLRGEIEHILSGQAKKSRVPPLWDGNAAERIADVITGSKMHSNS